MSYVSIVEKLENRYHAYMREAYTNVDLFNQGDWDGDTSYMFTCAEKVKEKIEKVRRLMSVEYFEYTEYDFGGFPYVLLWNVAVNGKMMRKWFKFGETLPDGTKIEFRTIEQ